jgi:hypothetical protein
MWEDSAESWSGVSGTPEGESEGGGWAVRREMDILSRDSRSALTVSSCTGDEEADEPEQMVCSIERRGSMSQFVTNPCRVEVVEVKR